MDDFVKLNPEERRIFFERTARPRNIGAVRVIGPASAAWRMAFRSALPKARAMRSGSVKAFKPAGKSMANTTVSPASRPVTRRTTSSGWNKNESRQFANRQSFRGGTLPEKQPPHFQRQGNDDNAPI